MGRLPAVGGGRDELVVPVLHGDHHAVDRVHRPAHVIGSHHAEQGEPGPERPAGLFHLAAGQEAQHLLLSGVGGLPVNGGQAVNGGVGHHPSAGEEAGLLSRRRLPQHTDELADVGAQGGHAGGQAALPQGGLRVQGIAPQGLRLRALEEQVEVLLHHGGRREGGAGGGG